MNVRYFAPEVEALIASLGCC